MQLFPDQIEVKQQLRDALNEHKAALLVASTGFGKTTLTVDILRAVPSAWFVVHRKRLFKDVQRALERAGIDHGYIASGKPYDPSKGVYICMARTLANRIDAVPEPHLVVVDEAHNIAAKTYDDIATKGKFRLLLTATPERTDGTGLGKYAPVMVQAPPMKWLIDNKRLSPYKYYAPTSADTSGLTTRAGEYTTASVDQLMDESTIVGDCVESYTKYASGKCAIAFAHSIKAAQEMADRFNAAGIPAASLESSLTDEESDEVADALEAGTLKVVVSVNMILEGYDLPAIECIIWARPTQSLIVSKQGNGRGLRYIESKTCIILDHVSNYKRHGLPDDAVEWSLEGKKKRTSSDEATIAVKECERCHCCYSPAAECPECGYINPVKERIVKQTKGELEEIKRVEEEAKQERKREQAQARTIPELVAFATKYNYKNPSAWANIIYKARKRR